MKNYIQRATFLMRENQYILINTVEGLITRLMCFMDTKNIIFRADQ